MFLEAREDTQPVQQTAAHRRTWLPWAVAAICAAAALVLAFREPAVPVQRLRHFTFAPASPELLIRNRTVAISPNGRYITFSASGKVWIRHLDKVEPYPVEASEGADGVIWSPDSSSFVFASGGELRRVSIQGGRPAPLCTLTQFRGGAWTAQSNKILFSDAGKGLMEVSSIGGEPKLVFSRRGQAIYNPAWISETKRVVLAAMGNLTDQRIGIIFLDSGEVKILREGGWPIVAPSGHIPHRGELG